MDIQAEKIELARLLLSTNNPDVIKSIKEILEKEASADFWNELIPEQQAEINKALDELDRGKVVDYELFMAKHRK